MAVSIEQHTRDGSGRKFEPFTRKPEEFIVEDPEILYPGNCNSVADYLEHLQGLVLPSGVGFEVVSENGSRLRKLDPDRTVFFHDGVITTTRIAVHTYHEFQDGEQDSYTAYLDVRTSYGHFILPFQSTEVRTDENVNLFNESLNQKSFPNSR